MSLPTRPSPTIRTIFWLLSLAVAVAAVIPGERLPSGLFDWWDKAQHFSAFFVLTALGFIAHPLRPHWFIATGLAGWGLGIEVVQYSLSWRHGDGWDFAADCLGIAAAWGLWRFFQWRRHEG